MSEIDYLALGRAVLPQACALAGIVFCAIRGWRRA